jgi:hypothetical protein
MGMNFHMVCATHLAHLEKMPLEHTAIPVLPVSSNILLYFKTVTTETRRAGIARAVQ